MSLSWCAIFTTELRRLMLRNARPPPIPTFVPALSVLRISFRLVRFNKCFLPNNQSVTAKRKLVNARPTSSEAGRAVQKSVKFVGKVKNNEVVLATSGKSDGVQKLLHMDPVVLMDAVRDGVQRDRMLSSVAY